MDLDLPSVADMVAELRRLTNEVERAMGEVFALATELPELDKDFEVAYHSAVQRSKGASADKRKADAVLASIDQHEALQRVEVLLQAKRQFVNVLQTALSAAQSIAEIGRASCRERV